MNNAVLAVCAGGLSALIFMAPYWGGPLGMLLMYVTPLPLLAAGLGLGSQSVVIAAGSGLVTVGLIGGMSTTGSFGAAGIYGGLHALPACLIIYQALMKKRSGEHGDPEAWFPPGSILASLTLLGALGAIGIALGLSGGDGISSTIRGLLQTALETAMPTVPAADLGAVTDTLVPWFLGVSVVMWVTMMAINGIVAQSILTRRSANIRPRPRWSDLTLPDWCSWPVVICAGIALLADGDAGYVARNLVVVFATPFFFLGLAVVHSLFAKFAQRAFALAAIYAGLVLFFFPAAGILAALGFAEQWAGVRSRFSKPNKDNSAK